MSAIQQDVFRIQRELLKESYIQMIGKDYLESGKLTQVKAEALYSALFEETMEKIITYLKEHESNLPFSQTAEKYSKNFSYSLGQSINSKIHEIYKVTVLP